VAAGSRRRLGRNGQPFLARDAYEQAPLKSIVVHQTQRLGALANVESEEAEWK